MGGSLFHNAAVSDVSRVPIASLNFSIAVRVGEDAQHVRVLAGVEDPLPPIVVHRSSRSVIDGLHRLRARALSGEPDIDVVYFDGTWSDAYVFGVRANISHGLPLSIEEREGAAARILADFPQWSDRAIASAAGLTARAVRGLRSSSGGAESESTVRIGRDGRARPLDAAAGRRAAWELLQEEPGIPIRELARRAGVSVGTACDVRKRARTGVDPLPDGLRSRERLAQSPGPAPHEAVGEGSSAPEERRASLRILTMDPSLRLRTHGRSLLRWLDVATATVDHRAAVVEGVPAHCVPAVVELARASAQMLTQLAEEFENPERLRAADSASG